VRLGAVKGINAALPYFVGVFCRILMKFIVEDLQVMLPAVVENRDGLLCITA
jgi:hypothetical protein